MKKVLVAMSGGTDSSAVCLMLLEQGYQVEGMTMRMWDTPSKFSQAHQEQPDYILKAQQLAQKMNFPHHILDVRNEFKQCVINDFLGEYLAGRTPNPCVCCNIHVKTKFLLDMANERGCDYIATGHYANIAQENGLYFIERGIDARKDQSYFLWGLRQNVLSRMLFPLGNYTKTDARSETSKNGFEDIAHQPESQDICFVENDYRTFLRQQQPDIDQQIGAGNFVDTEGRVVGHHKGYPYYTIGQRKGLELALGTPVYVLQIKPETNEIVVGQRSDLMVKQMRLRNCYFPSKDLFSPDEVLYIRIRYKSRAVPGYVLEITESDALIEFFDSTEAITPGQSAVIYRNERVLGGGIIV